jgi:hypothetical protein
MRTLLRLLPLALSVAGCGQAPTATWLTDPGVAGHARYLPLAGTSHDPSTHPSITCDSCHPGTTFQEPVCTGCHGESETTALHTRTTTRQALAGFTWTAPPRAGVPWERPSCLVCHPQGGVPDFVHEAYFPVGAGTAHDRSCSACHGDPLDKGDLSTLRCITCHSGPAVRVPLPGPHATLLRADSWPAVPTAADCLRCHDRAQVDRVASHGTRQGPAGSGRAGPWDGSATADCSLDRDACKHGKPGSAVNCFACHNALPPLFGGPGAGRAGRPWAQDWKIPASTANQAAGAACRGCHGPE